MTIKAQDKLSGVLYMRVSNTKDMSKATWVPYKAEFDWDLEPLAGNDPQQRHVYVQLADGAQNVSHVFKGGILLKP